MPRYKDDPILDLNTNGSRALKTYVNRLKRKDMKPALSPKINKAMMRAELKARGVVLLRYKQTQINGVTVESKWVKAVVGYDPCGQTGSHVGKFLLNGTPVPRDVVDRAVRMGVAQ